MSAGRSLLNYSRSLAAKAGGDVIAWQGRTLTPPWLILSSCNLVEVSPRPVEGGGAGRSHRSFLEKREDEGVAPRHNKVFTRGQTLVVFSSTLTC
jgi:hypothetical protein